jgi:alanine racemase
VTFSWPCWARPRLAPDLPEGIALYVLNGLMPGTEAHCATIKAIPVLNSLDQIARWSAQAKALGPPARRASGRYRHVAHGPSADELDLLLADPALLDGIEPRLLISHLACADEADDPPMPWARFQEIAARFPHLPSRSTTAGRVSCPPAWRSGARGDRALWRRAP